MDKSKKMISAVVCLALSMAVMAASASSFLAARNVPLPERGPSVTEVKMLSDWFEGVKGTNADTPVYVLQGKKEGGKMLILGGTHANEVSGYMSAFTFIENAVVEMPVEQDNRVFNLAGQQVAPGTKGIVIKNGRKYLNK